jgi:hypothetical protein
MKSDHIKRLITLTSDNNKRLSLYFAFSGNEIKSFVYTNLTRQSLAFQKFNVEKKLI